MARKIFYGQRGEGRKRYREGLEDQLGALGLVVNAVALWTSFYLVREHVHVLGRYQFTLEESVAEGSMRPLHDPAELEEYELSVLEPGH